MEIVIIIELWIFCPCYLAIAMHQWSHQLASSPLFPFYLWRHFWMCLVFDSDAFLFFKVFWSCTMVFFLLLNFRRPINYSNQQTKFWRQWLLNLQSTRFLLTVFFSLVDLFLRSPVIVCWDWIASISFLQFDLIMCSGVRWRIYYHPNLCGHCFNFCHPKNYWREGIHQWLFRCSSLIVVTWSH